MLAAAVEVLCPGGRRTLLIEPTGKHTLCKRDFTLAQPPSVQKVYRAFLRAQKNTRLTSTEALLTDSNQTGKLGPGGGSRTHTGSDPRQILSLLRLPVPPLRDGRQTIES